MRIDSTFTSVAKLTARGWSAERDEPDARHMSRGRMAIIAATTIGGTMVMGSRRSSCYPG